MLKIEPPEGDLMRRARPRRDGIALYWAQVNCGKRCLCLDLARPEAQQVARELAGHSDVVVENFRPGVMARMGLGPEQLRERRPDLVYCSISGYGQTGPAAQRRAYAPVIHAELGLLELGTHRGTEPLPEPVSHADFAVAAQATSAILAALFHRQRSGEGQHVDVSMAETMLAVMEWTAIEANGGMGSQLPTFYPAKAVIVRLGDGSHAALPGFPASAFPPGARSRRWPTCPGEDWAQARGAFATLDDGEGGTMLLPYSPLRFSGLEVGLRGRPARQGQHNREVLGELLGCDDATIDRLEAGGVLVQRP